MLLTIRQQVLCAGRIGKINDYIACTGKLKRISINRKTGMLFRVDIKTGNDFHILFIRNNIADDAAHPAVAAGKCNFQHL